MMNLLKQIRDERGLSQERLGELVGADQSTIHRYETKDLFPPRLRAICRALRVNPADILLPADNPERLSDEERSIVQAFRHVPPENRSRILRILLIMLEEYDDSDAA